MADDFLDRWSRRKQEARAAEATRDPAAVREAESTAPAPTPPTGEPASQSNFAPAPDLPAIDSLRGLASEYRDFLHPQVDEGTRRAALRKLFADPHFNVMDGLDVYIDDYSKPDPIPAAMLASLDILNRLVAAPPAREGESATAEGSAAAGEPACPPVAERPTEPERDPVSPDSNVAHDAPDDTPRPDA